MKETRLINRFSEKILIWGNGPFWAQKLHILITLDPLEEFFKILRNEKGQWVHESNNNGLYQTNLVKDNWAIVGPKMAHLITLDWL